MSRGDLSTPLRPDVAARGPVATGVAVLAAWALILGVVVGVGWLITRPWRQEVDSFDDPIARWFAAERTAALTASADVGMLFGETIVGMGVALVAAVAFSLWQRGLRPAVFLALVAAGVGGVYFVATHVDPRQRPPVRILDPGLVPDHSFPSGHVGTATAVYGAIVVLCWAYARSSRRWVWVLLVLPVVVLLARLYQGAHHLTDVVTSVLYAGAWLLVLARLLLTGVADRLSSGR
jgi:undecaprenyl-diphosphatase